MLEEFYTFPSNRSEALTMLYLSSQDLSGLSPEGLADLYLEANSRINKQFADRAKTKK